MEWCLPQCRRFPDCCFPCCLLVCVCCPNSAATSLAAITFGELWYSCLYVSMLIYICCSWITWSSYVCVFLILSCSRLQILRLTAHGLIRLQQSIHRFLSLLPNKSVTESAASDAASGRGRVEFVGNVTTKYRHYIYPNHSLKWVFLIVSHWLVHIFNCLCFIYIAMKAGNNKNSSY